MTNGVGADDDRWTLTPEDHVMVISKHRGTRLGFAILLVFFRDRGRFRRHECEVARQSIAALGQQLDVQTPMEGGALLSDRTAERFRAEIRAYFGFREATVADADALLAGVRDHAAPNAAGDLDLLIENLEERCLELAIEPPTAERMERIVRTAQRAHNRRSYRNIAAIRAATAIWKR